MADKTENIPPSQASDQRQTNISSQTGFPGPANVPNQTAQTGFTGQTSIPGQANVPGQTYIPGHTGIPGQTYVCGQTGIPSQGYPPGQTGYWLPATTGQTGFLGQASFPQGQVLPGGQLQNQQVLAGQTGHGSVYPPSNCAQAGQPDLDVIYRTGNFGKNYGKVNIGRGKKWVVIHAVLTCLMIILTTLAMMRMKYFSDGVSFKKYLVMLPCLCCLSDVLACSIAGYFMWRLSSLGNPYRFYMILRIFAIIDICLNLNFIVVGPLSALIYKNYFIVPSGGSTPEGSGWGDDGSGGGHAKLVVATKTIYGFITLLMLIKVFVAHSYVFSWWGYLPGGGSMCACCAPCCIMEESSGLAPGVDNPPNLLQPQGNAGQRGVQSQGNNRA